MALIPSSRYPAQTDTGDAGYPHGKPRNAGSYQDGTGTPLEKDWLADLWGSQQALLDAGGVTPSGDPDEVGASQYLEALVSIASLKVAIYDFFVFDGSPIAQFALFALTERFQRGGFTMADDVITMPRAGEYLALLTGVFRSSSTDNPKRIGIAFDAFSQANVTRFSGVADHQVSISLMKTRTVTVDPEDPEVLAGDTTLQVQSNTDGGLMSGAGTLFVLAL